MAYLIDDIFETNPLKRCAILNADPEKTSQPRDFTSMTTTTQESGRGVRAEIQTGPGLSATVALQEIYTRSSHYLCLDLEPRGSPSSNKPTVAENAVFVDDSLVELLKAEYSPAYNTLNEKGALRIRAVDMNNYITGLGMSGVSWWGGAGVGEGAEGGEGGGAGGVNRKPVMITFVCPEELTVPPTRTWRRALDKHYQTEHVTIVIVRSVDILAGPMLEVVDIMHPIELLASSPRVDVRIVTFGVESVKDAVVESLAKSARNLRFSTTSSEAKPMHRWSGGVIPYLTKRRRIYYKVDPRSVDDFEVSVSVEGVESALTLTGSDIVDVLYIEDERVAREIDSESGYKMITARTGVEFEELDPSSEEAGRKQRMFGGYKQEERGRGETEEGGMVSETPLATAGGEAVEQTLPGADPLRAKGSERLLGIGRAFLSFQKAREHPEVARNLIILTNI